MNTQTVVWIIAAVVVLGGLWYILATPGSTTTTGTATSTASVYNGADQNTAANTGMPTTDTNNSAVTKTAGVGSLSSLIALKSPLVCSVKTTSGTLRSGTLYVAGGKARANFSGSTMIDDGTSLYAWNSGATLGTKLPASVGASGSTIVSKGGVDPATNLSYNCVPWTVNTNLFVPPATVTF